VCQLEGLYISFDIAANDGFLYLLIFQVLSTMTSMYFVFVIQRGLGSAVSFLPSFLPFLGTVKS